MPDLHHEEEMRRSGHAEVAGVDEAGRGPLAGPVVAAAVVLPPGYSHDRLDDSKKLSPAAREAVYADLVADPRVRWAWALVEAEEIDRLDILRATWLAMARAFGALDPAPSAALIDGRPVRGFPAPHRALVGGDSLSLSVAAASVVAKVERDRIMLQWAQRHPVYGFERNKGYGTAAHLEALRRHGPCPIHRRSFAPVAREGGDGT